MPARRESVSQSEHRPYSGAGCAVARQLDELLWTFRDGSFLPHGIVGEMDVETPVSIGAAMPESRVPDLLINLTDAVPDRTGTFPRIAEIVPPMTKPRTAAGNAFAE